MASQQAELSDVINLNSSAIAPKISGAVPTAADSSAVPVGFALLIQLKESSTVPGVHEGSLLARFATESVGLDETRMLPKMLQDALHAAEVSAMPVPLPANLNHVADIVTATLALQSVDQKVAIQQVTSEPVANVSEVGIQTQLTSATIGATPNAPVIATPEPAAVPVSTAPTVVTPNTPTTTGPTSATSMAITAAPNAHVFSTPEPTAAPSSPTPKPTVVTTNTPTSTGALPNPKLMNESGVLSGPMPEEFKQVTLKVGGAETVGRHAITASAVTRSDLLVPTKAVMSIGPTDIKTSDRAQPELRVNLATTIIASTVSALTIPLQEVVKFGASVPQVKGQPQIAGAGWKSQSDPASPLPAGAHTSVTKSANFNIGAPVAQDQQTTERSSAMGNVTSKTDTIIELEKSVSGVFNPANRLGEPLETPERARSEMVSVLATTSSKAEVAVSASLQDTHVKAVPKPFAEALMGQVKSVEAVQGRTTVNLIPRGLGQIEIEVLSDKDVASKVVVRAENPAVLQALRDDKQLLAQAIGVSDSSIFDFQEQNTGDQSGAQQKNANQSDDVALCEVTNAQSQQQSRDVVQDGQLDIMT